MRVGSHLFLADQNGILTWFTRYFPFQRCEGQRLGRKQCRCRNGPIFNQKGSQYRYLVYVMKHKLSNIMLVKLYQLYDRSFRAIQNAKLSAVSCNGSSFGEIVVYR